MLRNPRFLFPAAAVFAACLGVAVFAAGPSRLDWSGELNQFNHPKGSGWWLPYHTVELPFSGMITAIVYTPDGKRMIASSDHGELAAFEAATGRVLWRTGTHKYKHEIFVFDVSPDGKRFTAGPFLPRSQKETSDDRKARQTGPLQIRDTTTGSVLKTIDGISVFWHAHLGDDGVVYEETDMRKNAKNEQFYEETGYLKWAMIAYTARFTPDGKHILVHWRNDREDFGLIDHRYDLLDANTYQRIWFWQVVNDKIEICDRGTQNDKIMDGMLHAPFSWSSRLNRLIVSQPDADVREVDLATIKKNMTIENVHDKDPGKLVLAIEREMVRR